MNKENKHVRESASPIYQTPHLLKLVHQYPLHDEPEQRDAKWLMWNWSNLTLSPSLLLTNTSIHCSSFISHKRFLKYSYPVLSKMKKEANPNGGFNLLYLCHLGENFDFSLIVASTGGSFEDNSIRN